MDDAYGRVDVGGRGAAAPGARVISIQWVLVAVFGQIVITFWTCITMYLRPLSVAACDTTCDYQTMAVAVNTFFIVVGVISLATIPALIMLRRRGWWALAPCAAGSAGILITFLVTNHLALRSVGL